MIIRVLIICVSLFATSAYTMSSVKIGCTCQFKIINDMSDDERNTLKEKLIVYRDAEGDRTNQWDAVLIILERNGFVYSRLNWHGYSAENMIKFIEKGFDKQHKVSE